MFLLSMQMGASVQSLAHQVAFAAAKRANTVSRDIEATADTDLDQPLMATQVAPSTHESLGPGPPPAPPSNAPCPPSSTASCRTACTGCTDTPASRAGLSASACTKAGNMSVLVCTRLSFKTVQKCVHSQPGEGAAEAGLFLLQLW